MSYSTPSSFKAFEFDAGWMLEFINRPVTQDEDECEFIGLIVSQSPFTAASGGILAAPGFPPADLFIDKVFYRKHLQDFIYSDSFGSQAANQVLRSQENSYVAVNEEERASLRSESDFEYRAGSANGSQLHFCFFAKGPLIDITSRSRKIVISGAQISLGNLAYPMSDEESRSLFAFKIEGDLRNQNTVLRSRASRMASRSFSIGTEADASPLLPEPSPFLTNVVLGQPCPPAWLIPGVVEKSNQEDLGLKWMQFIQQIQLDRLKKE